MLFCVLKVKTQNQPEYHGVQVISPANDAQYLDRTYSAVFSLKSAGHLMNCRNSAADISVCILCVKMLAMIGLTSRDRPHLLCLCRDSSRRLNILCGN